MASCNGCTNKELERRLGKKYQLLVVGGMPTVYELDADPIAGQGDPKEWKGRPIRFHVAFMELGHSYDEDCYQRRTK